MRCSCGGRAHRDERAVQVKEINLQLLSSLGKEELWNPFKSKNPNSFSIFSQSALSEIMYSISLLPFLVDILKNCPLFFMSYSVLSDIEPPLRHTLCFSETSKPICREFLKREVLYNDDEHIVLKLWRLTTQNCFGICTYWNKKSLYVCLHFSGLLWFITLALQSSE